MPKRDLNPEEEDMLREIGNIGCGRAATALSKLTNQRVKMSVPEVAVMSVEKTPQLTGKPEELTAFIVSKLTGNLEGDLSVVLPLHSAETLLKVLLRRTIGQWGELDEMEESALVEVANILSGSFVTAMADMLGLNLRIGVPRLTIDMTGASLQSMAVEYGLRTDLIFAVKAELISCGEVIGMYVLLLLDEEQTELLLKKAVEMVPSRWGASLQESK